LLLTSLTFIVYETSTEIIVVLANYFYNNDIQFLLCGL